MIPTKVYYICIDVLSVIVPFVFSFYPGLRFDKKWKYAFPALIIPAIFFILWDFGYTYLGVWGFNNRYLLGLQIFNLPIEEILFFICIPYACLFTYFSLDKLTFKKYKPGTEKKLGYVFGILCLILAIIYFHKLYTVATFTLLGGFLIYVGSKSTLSLSKFIKVYSLLLIPFFIVNGILTGSGLPEPIVWYNAKEQIGLRILTIPIEDFFYGMLLILQTVYLFEYFQKKVK